MVLRKSTKLFLSKRGKMEGTVKWFNGQKGYGFISGEDGQDYFVHHSQIPEGSELREGDNVSFEPVETEKGIQAQNLTLG